MKKTVIKYISLLVSITMVLGCAGVAFAEEKPATWIADRVVQVQAYVDDIGYSLPEDQLNTPTMLELQKKTGMRIEFLYTPGEKDRYVMAAQLATGNLPDMICFYLNNSSRPEFPILHSAAKEGMFTDIAPYLDATENLVKYKDPEWLPADTYQNICWREDFAGACYFMHLQIDRLGRKTPIYWKETQTPGGLYIQRAIAEDLGVDPRTIHSSEALYELLKTIQGKNYKDNNGNVMVPLGPKYWGGSPDAVHYVINDLNWGMSGDFNRTEDGQILHEAQTDWAFKKIDYFRKLLAEGLVHKEYFTMDSTRAKELYENKSAAIISDVHGGIDIIYMSDDWVPLGMIADYKGGIKEISKGAGGYGGWAIPETTKNPEEIIQLMDFFASRDGQLLSTFGVEGLTYTMGADGNPVPTKEIMDAIAAGDSKLLYNYGAAFDGSGVYGMIYLQSNVDFENYFGCASFGANVEGATSKTNDRIRQLSKDYAREIQVLSGLDINSFMSEMPDFNTAFNLLSYDDMFIQACFAKDDAAVRAIVESFRAQLEQAGIGEYEKLVETKYEANPDTIFVY